MDFFMLKTNEKIFELIYTIRGLVSVDEEKSVALPRGLKLRICKLFGTIEGL